MTNDLMIPDEAQVPDYIRNQEAAKAANAEAAAGISTGFPQRVKINGKQFSLVNGNGEETPFPPANMTAAADGNTYLPVIVLRGKEKLSKSWYAAAYNPALEAEAPDCFSNDAEKPDVSVQNPQSPVCASCPQNAFGSGRDQNGNATNGKACTDNKILAVFVPGFGVHSLKIPPASLKNWGIYVGKLTDMGIPFSTVKTLVGFEMTSEFPVLVFAYGGFLGQELIPKTDELAKSDAVKEIIGGITVAPKIEAPVETDPTPVAETTSPPIAETTAPPQTAVPDDMGLDALSAGTATETVETPAASADPQEVSDAQLMEELGL